MRMDASAGTQLRATSPALSLSLSVSLSLSLSLFLSVCLSAHFTGKFEWLAPLASKGNFVYLWCTTHYSIIIYFELGYLLCTCK